ncbi:MAG TPA: hypothetical protein VFQ44_20050 [Streptosporangiaceae bacterium]|nr:hypothetical protein [Streptosporangiaceae bacterium]
MLGNVAPAGTGAADGLAGPADVLVRRLEAAGGGNAIVTDRAFPGPVSRIGVRFVG